MNNNPMPGRGNRPDGSGDPNNRNNNGKMPKNGQTILIFLVVSLVALLVINFFSSMLRQTTEQEITYDQFLEMVEKGEVNRVIVRSNEIEIVPKDQPFPGVEITYFTGVMDDPDLVQYLREAGVQFEREIP